MALGIYNGIVSDNAQNRVLLPVSNSKSLAFDGSDDHLTTAADSTLATKTYSWWSQSADTGINGVFDHGDYNIGAFIFNYSSNKPLLYLAADWFRYWNDTSCQDDGSFHHWMLLLHTNISNCRLFCDGVEQTVQSTATGSGAGTSYTTGLRIGRAGTNYFSGHIDEFAVLDGDQTKLVADLYNSGVPTNIGQYAALEHWWRMGDATEPAADGTDDLIFDQQDKTLGSELITNGAFSSDVSGWAKDGDASSTIGYDSGRLKVTAATSYDGAVQSVSGLVAGQTYKFSADYEFGTATQLQIRAGSEPSTDLSSPSSGTALNYFTASATSMNIYVRTGGSTGTIFFDNVSVKKVNGAAAKMTNMASSDIVQYTPNSYILSDLGITPDLAVSMTRKLMSDYSGDFYATSGSDVTTIYDQSSNSRNLTNYGSGDEVTLSGSGNLALAVFSSSSNSVLTTGTLGSAFAEGNHDVFMVFDPVGTDQQILFGRASTGGDFLAMDNGSSSNASNGITIGEIRVNDTVLSATVTRNALWDAMTVAGTMSGLNVLSLEDVDLSTIGGDIRLGASNNTWRLEGSFAEFIITPPLSDADHSAIVDNIRAPYDAP